MSLHRGRAARRAFAVAVVGALLAPALLSAQSELASTEATEFLGAWTIDFETPQGPASMAVNIEDREGKVAAHVSFPDYGMGVDITDISRSGPGLVLRYTLDFEGTPINASMTLRPEEESYIAALDFADGQFVMDAPAKRND